jgi:hypothetical protein
MSNHSQSDQKNDNLNLTSNPHIFDTSILVPTSVPTSDFMDDDHNSKKKIETLFDTINFLQRYSTYIDAIMHRINVIYVNGYEHDFETTNKFLSRIPGLCMTSISYSTKTLELSFDQKLYQVDNQDYQDNCTNIEIDVDNCTKTKTEDKSNTINFTLDWTQSVEQNISCLLRNIYRIKKNKMMSTITITNKKEK